MSAFDPKRTSPPPRRVSDALDANDSRTKCIHCQRIVGLCADPVAAYPVKTRSLP